MNLQDIKAYCKDPKNRSIVNVGLFILLIISFHYLYLGWQTLGYWPVGKLVYSLMVWSVDMVYGQACWVLDHIFHLDITTISEKRLIAAINRDGGWAGVLLMQVVWPNIHIHLMGQDINTFQLAHDYVFKVFFYLIIFLMWVLWVEKFYNKSIETKS